MCVCQERHCWVHTDSIKLMLFMRCVFVGRDTAESTGDVWSTRTQVDVVHEMCVCQERRCWVHTDSSWCCSRDVCLSGETLLSPHRLKLMLFTRCVFVGRDTAESTGDVRSTRTQVDVVHEMCVCQERRCWIHWWCVVHTDSSWCCSWDVCLSGETLLSPLVMCGPHGLKLMSMRCVFVRRDTAESTGDVWSTRTQVDVYEMCVCQERHCWVHWWCVVHTDSSWCCLRDVCLSGETLLSPLVMCGPHGLKLMLFMRCVFVRRDTAESTGDVWSTWTQVDVVHEMCVCQERHCWVHWWCVVHTDSSWCCSWDVCLSGETLLNPLVMCGPHGLKLMLFMRCVFVRRDAAESTGDVWSTRTQVDVVHEMCVCQERRCWIHWWCVVHTDSSWCLWDVCLSGETLLSPLVMCGPHRLKLMFMRCVFVRRDTAESTGDVWSTQTQVDVVYEMCVCQERHCWVHWWCVVHTDSSWCCSWDVCLSGETLLSPLVMCGPHGLKLMLFMRCVFVRRDAAESTGDVWSTRTQVDVYEMCVCQERHCWVHWWCVVHTDSSWCLWDVCLSGETLLSPLVMCGPHRLKLMLFTRCVFVRRDTAESTGDVWSTRTQVDVVHEMYVCRERHCSVHWWCVVHMDSSWCCSWDVCLSGETLLSPLVMCGPHGLKLMLFMRCVFVRRDTAESTGDVWSTRTQVDVHEMCVCQERHCWVHWWCVVHTDSSWCLWDVCLSGETLLSPLVMCGPHRLKLMLFTRCVFVRRDTAESTGDVWSTRTQVDVVHEMCVCQERHCWVHWWCVVHMDSSWCCSWDVCLSGETLLSPLVMCGPHGLKLMLFMRCVFVRRDAAESTGDVWSTRTQVDVVHEMCVCQERRCWIHWWCVVHTDSSWCLWDVCLSGETLLSPLVMCGPHRLKLMLFTRCVFVRRDTAESTGDVWSTQTQVDVVYEMCVCQERHCWVHWWCVVHTDSSWCCLRDVCLSGETLLSPLVMCGPHGLKLMLFMRCMFVGRDTAESTGDVWSTWTQVDVVHEMCVCQEGRCWVHWWCVVHTDSSWCLWDVCLSGETLLSPLVMCGPHRLKLMLFTRCVFVRRDTAESTGDVWSTRTQVDVVHEMYVCRERHCWVHWWCVVHMDSSWCCSWDVCLSGGTLLSPLVMCGPHGLKLMLFMRCVFVRRDAAESTGDVWSTRTQVDVVYEMCVCQERHCWVHWWCVVHTDSSWRCSWDVCLSGETLLSPLVMSTRTQVDVVHEMCVCQERHCWVHWWCVVHMDSSSCCSWDVCLSGETLLSPLVMCGPHGLKLMLFMRCVFVRRDAAESTGDVWSTRTQVPAACWTAPTPLRLRQPWQLVLCSQV